MLQNERTFWTYCIFLSLRVCLLITLCLSFSLPSIHNNILSFRCPICQRCFNQKSNLKTHLLTHTDVKPKQLLEIAERLESSGCRPTCGSSSGSTVRPVLEPQIKDMTANSDDIAEPEIDVLCSDDDATSPIPTPPVDLVSKLRLLHQHTEPIRRHAFSIAELMKK